LRLLEESRGGRREQPELGPPDEWSSVMQRTAKFEKPVKADAEAAKPDGPGELWYPPGWVDPLQDKAPLTKEEKDALAEKRTWKPFHAVHAVPQRDLLVDLRRHRSRTLSEGATQAGAPIGPVWPHLAAKAKNLAGVFTIDEILEAMKLFASVRYGDTELYLMLLGELPRLLPEAPAITACEVIRLLGRVRLRERSYVEMLTVFLMPFLRAAADAGIPARVFVQTGNALAALDIRTHGKFLSTYLRHFQFRILEFTAELIELFSPLFVVRYMNDEARKVFLQRAAETNAGFHGRPGSARNLALIEFALRREHHSLISVLPSFVPRYLDKIKHLAVIQRDECVYLPRPAVSAKIVYAEGIKSQSQMFSLRAKVSTAHEQMPQLPGVSRPSVNVFSSSMHEDVSSCLDHLGILHENGIPAGPFLLDICARNAEYPDHRVIFEVDDPSKYYLGTQLLTAEATMRHQLLGRIGYNGIHIAHYDWNHLSPAHRAKYLLGLYTKACEQGVATQQRRRPQQPPQPSQRTRDEQAVGASPRTKKALPQVPRLGLPPVDRTK
jgi:hypothetical protein